MIYFHRILNHNRWSDWYHGYHHHVDDLPGHPATIGSCLLVCYDNCFELRISRGWIVHAQPDDSKDATFIDVPPVSIEGSSWELNYFNDGSGAFAPLISDWEIKAEFGADGSMTGFAGRNTYNTSCEIEGGNIKNGPFATTTMMFQEPEGDPEKENSC